MDLGDGRVVLAAREPYADRAGENHHAGAGDDWMESVTRAADFDALAGIYRLLEYASFGNTLMRARVAFLPHVVDARRVLVLGDGDGRGLRALLAHAEQAEVVSVDVSRKMLALAERGLDPAERRRVTFVAADARELALERGGFDVVVAPFFMDCLTEPELLTVLARVQPLLAPRARLLLAEFALPARGLSRLRARIWLFVLYAFFRATAGLHVRTLPDFDAALARIGFAPIAERHFSGGLLRSALFMVPEGASRMPSSPQLRCLPRAERS
jgi:ubiquinone/menaquinone biosynthesis C-methylase UbiE